MVWLQGLAFALGTLLLALSWRVLLRPQSHGFYRFFAWEAILALLVLNGPVWFVDRFALHQRLSWALLFASLLLLFTGLYQLRRMGRPDGQRKDAELFAFERTSQLVTSGIFRVIRHPPSAVRLVAVAGLGRGLQATQWLESGASAAGQSDTLADRQARRSRVSAAVWRGVSRLYAAQQDVYSLVVLISCWAVIATSGAPASIHHPPATTPFPQGNDGRYPGSGFRRRPRQPGPR
jgi:protein-S-isoprenylcysteine O-methyltransferase Ste14